MPQLTQEQYNILKQKGLSDEKIKQIAEAKGFDLPGGDIGLAGISAGFVKGGLEISRETAQLAQNLGQIILATITPGISLGDVRQKTGFKSLDETTSEGQVVTDILKAKTTEEKIGKIAANVASFFIPTAKTAQVGGRVVKGVGEAVTKLGIGVSAKEAPLLQAYKAKFPLTQRISAVLKGERLAGKPILARETALKQGIAGTESIIGIQAKRGSGRLWQEVISPALKKIPIKIKMKDFIDDITKEVNKVNDLSRKRELKTALDAFKLDHKKVGEISFEQLQRFKEGWAKFLPDKVYKGKPIASSFREIQNMAAQLARNKIYNAVDDISIKAAYFDYGNLKNLEKLGQSALTGQKLKGGFGGFISGSLDMVLTPIASIGGLTLYKVGKGIEFIGAQGLKTVGQIFGL